VAGLPDDAAGLGQSGGVYHRRVSSPRRSRHGREHASGRRSCPPRTGTSAAPPVPGGTAARGCVWCRRSRR
jgi:hypothetical protein